MFRTWFVGRCSQVTYIVQYIHLLSGLAPKFCTCKSWFPNGRAYSQQKVQKVEMLVSLRGLLLAQVPHLGGHSDKKFGKWSRC